MSGVSILDLAKGDLPSFPTKSALASSSKPPATPAPKTPQQRVLFALEPPFTDDDRQTMGKVRENLTAYKVPAAFHVEVPKILVLLSTFRTERESEHFAEPQTGFVFYLQDKTQTYVTGAGLDTQVNYDLINVADRVCRDIIWNGTYDAMAIDAIACQKNRERSAALADVQQRLYPRYGQDRCASKTQLTVKAPQNTELMESLLRALNNAIGTYGRDKFLEGSHGILLKGRAAPEKSEVTFYCVRTGVSMPWLVRYEVGAPPAASTGPGCLPRVAPYAPAAKKIHVEEAKTKDAEMKDKEDEEEEDASADKGDSSEGANGGGSASTNKQQKEQDDDDEEEGGGDEDDEEDEDGSDEDAESTEQAPRKRKAAVAASAATAKQNEEEKKAKRVFLRNLTPEQREAHKAAQLAKKAEYKRMRRAQAKAEREAKKNARTEAKKAREEEAAAELLAEATSKQQRAAVAGKKRSAPQSEEKREEGDKEEEEREEEEVAAPKQDAKRTRNAPKPAAAPVAPVPAQDVETIHEEKEAGRNGGGSKKKDARLQGHVLPPDPFETNDCILKPVVDAKGRLVEPVRFAYCPDDSKILPTCTQMGPGLRPVLPLVVSICKVHGMSDDEIEAVRKVIDGKKGVVDKRVIEFKFEVLSDEQGHFIVVPGAGVKCSLVNGPTRLPMIDGRDVQPYLSDLDLLGSLRNWPADYFSNKFNEKYAK